MAKWPVNPTVINTRVLRLDGLAKASGRAKYPSDERPEGVLFGVILYSPYAHAQIKSIDTADAEKMPGVKAIHQLGLDQNGKLVGTVVGKTLRYHGDDIAAVAAETEEQARDAARAIKVEYEVFPHCVTEAQSKAPNAPKVNRAGAGGNLRAGRANTRGKPEEAMEKADVFIEAAYSLPVITHVCLEPHGLTARWDGPDKLTVWASTQSVVATANELAGEFGLSRPNVTVLTEVMGGGFGSKFGAEIWGRAAAHLARKAGRPVTIFLDRVQEHLAAGNRPSASGKIKIGAGKDGKLVALVAETFGTGGFPFPYVYDVPAQTRAHSDVLVNCGGARAMRAPGHPQGCALMEAAMDDLADKLGIDPLEFRLKNFPVGDKRTPIYEAEAELGATAFGWSQKYKPRGKNGPGPIKHGIGVAFHQWGGGPAKNNQVDCEINPDGSVELKTATQDIGTGARTLLAIIAAEILGLKPTDIKSNIGNSTFKPGQGSGGSTTSPSMSPPCYDAVTKARDAFFTKLAPFCRTAPGSAVDPADLSLKGGQLLVKGEAKMSWKDACRKLGQTSIAETGKFVEGLADTGVGGCQFAEVSVDVETGVVKVIKIVAVQDTGLIINKLAWESQVYGGVIGGLNYGLFEERVMDPVTGVMLNPDMELYKLAGLSDIPEIVVIPYESAEMKARGVIGVGEPPTISTAAAIGNAVSNAIGVRVPQWPMTPQNVLNALAGASKEG